MEIMADYKHFWLAAAAAAIYDDNYICYMLWPVYILTPYIPHSSEYTLL